MCIRDSSQASALLGHTTRVHLDYYSSWVSEDELEKAVEEYNQNLKGVALRRDLCHHLDVNHSGDLLPRDASSPTPAKEPTL